MKKISFLFIILFLIFCVACTSRKTDVPSETVNKVDYINSVKLDKYEFNYGEEINITGKISVIYSNEDIISYTINDDMVVFPENLNVGKNIITIKYVEGEIEVSKEVEIEIIEVIIPSTYTVSISNPKLIKSSFSNEDEIDISGTIVLTDNEGNRSAYNFTKDNVTLPNEINEGSNTIIISYIENDKVFTCEATFSYYIKQEGNDDQEKGKMVEDFLIGYYTNYEITGNLELIYEYEGISIDYESTNTKILSHTGRYNAPILDTEIEITYYFFIGTTDYIGNITLIAKGWGDYIDATFDYITKQMPATVYESFELPTSYNEYNASIEWLADDEECPNGYVTVKKLGDDYKMTLTCEVTVDGETRQRKYSVNCAMLTNIQKVNKTLSYYENLYEDMLISDNVTFVTKDETYGCKITYYSYNPDILTDKGVYRMPMYDIKINFMLIVTLGSDTEVKIIDLNIKGKEYDDTWDKIEYFLDRIHQDEIKTQKYTLYGSEEGYYYVPTQNIGYLPFYTPGDLKVTQDFLPSGSGLKPDTNRSYTYFITLHNTGMAAPTATAKGLNEYIHSTTREASWHFAVDDHEAYQHVPLNEVAWHAGDGGRTPYDIWYNSGHWGIGGGNYYSVGIETCVYSGVDYNWTMRNTAKLVSYLLVYYNLNPSRIRQHYDFSGKDCPQVLRQAGRWAEQLELINLEYFGRTQLQGVTFKWTSLNPEIMDNTGTVINNPGVDTNISYKVEVTFNGVTKEYTYTSLLKKI